MPGSKRAQALRRGLVALFEKWAALCARPGGGDLRSSDEWAEVAAELDHLRELVKRQTAGDPLG